MSGQENMVPFIYGDKGIRVVKDEHADPWFVAKDVCVVLELNNVTEALRGLDEDELSSVFLKSGGQSREMRTISESGLYALILRSNKPEAKRFRKWITSEVLPSIRKTGQYHASSPAKRVGIDHFRGTAAPGGLDIRYNLDLTKICVKPSRNGVRLLSRLTGIDMEDIVENIREMPQSHEDLVERFLETHCAAGDPEARTRASALYEAFSSWYVRNVERQVPSMKKFGEILARKFERKRDGTGCVVYRGLDLKHQH